MPRTARLDTPGTLHHVIIRGIERRQIVNDADDRRQFVDRLGQLALALQTSIYAWALLSNHAHLLLRSGPDGLPTFMRRLLTGYALAYNRRHRRHGHLFQNRYKSIVCEEDSYFDELVRYIHLNPLRAQLVTTLGELDSYAWCGHATLMGVPQQAWQDEQAVLARFGKTRAEAQGTYRHYMEEGLPQGRRPELVGGGLLRSRGGWAAVVAMRKHGDREFTDDRVLGSGEFVATLVREADERVRERWAARPHPQAVAAYVEHECSTAGVSVQALRQGGRGHGVSQVRTRLARQLVKDQGRSLAETARYLGVTTAAICKALQKDEGNFSITSGKQTVTYS